MAAYQAGSAAAVEQIYAALSRAVSRYLLAVTRDRTRTADLTQETFLQVHRARHTYDAARPVLPWVLAIARHVHLMDRRRATRRVRAVSLEDEPIDPATVFRDPEVWREVEQALEQVPPASREAWVLHHINGLRFKEIAEILGIGVSVTKLRSSRASARLRRVLVQVQSEG